MISKYMKTNILKKIFNMKIQNLKLRYYNNCNNLQQKNNYNIIYFFKLSISIIIQKLIKKKKIK